MATKYKHGRYYFIRKWSDDAHEYAYQARWDEITGEGHPRWDRLKRLLEKARSIDPELAAKLQVSARRGVRSAENDLEMSRAANRDSRKKAKKRKTPSAFKEKLSPSPRLVAVIGAGKVSRGEAMKKIWGVIKRRRLQLPGGRISVNDVLKPLFPGKRVAKITDVPGAVSRNLV